MKITTNRFLLPFLAILGFLLCIDPAWGQYLGSVSPQTVQTTLAPLGTACTGADQIFPVQNLGQGNHYAASAPSAAVTSFQMEIDGVDAAGNIYRISDQQRGTQGYTGGALPGSGYYPNIQVKVKCWPATTGTFGLTYSGGSSISPIDTGSYLFGQVDKLIANQAAAATDFSDSFQTPFGSSAGRLTFEWAGSAGTGATLTLSCAGALNLGGIWTWTFPLAASVLPQTFFLPTVPCTTVAVGYTHNSGGTTYRLDYAFSPPGSNASSNYLTLSSPFNLSPLLAEKGARWSITNSPAVSAQGTASKAANTNGYHVADCISYSAGATTAPAATQFTLNLRDGATSAGTVLWSKTVVIPATAANHLDGNVCGLNLMGSLATAMTLEFSAGLTNEFESVTLTGYDVQ